MDNEPSSAEYPTFYVDDSTCEIAGKNHVILAALTFSNEQKAIADWLTQKQLYGLHPYDEVKWNNKTISFDQRRTFVPLLNNGIGIVILDDSTRQAAAERLCTQVWWYCHTEGKHGFRLRFDNDIIEDRKHIKSHLRGFYPPCVGLSEHDSEYEQLIQCADFLAGAVKLKVDFGTGARDPNRKILVQGDVGSAKEEMELSFYFFAALRYCLWGVVRDCGDGETMFYPKKSVLGRGVLVNSSAQADLLEKATTFIDGDYMGCIH